MYAFADQGIMAMAKEFGDKQLQTPSETACCILVQF